LNCEPKSPLTKRNIEFIALILRSFSLTNDSNLSQTFTEEHNKSDEENQPPIGSQELDISLNFFRPQIIREENRLLLRSKKSQF